MTRPAPLVEVRAFRHRIGQFELGPLDFTLPEGTITALVGPNGAGKTTLLDLMFGMGRVQEGQVHIAGLAQPRDAVAIKQRVGFVSPDLNYTSWGNIGSALDFLSGFYPDWHPGECERLLDLFALQRSTKVAGLSFGERTRLSLIVALARDTDVLLLDEPTTGLDVAGRHRLFAELLHYVERAGRAVLISSHQLGELERLADRVIVLRQGRLAAQGEMNELVERYEQWDLDVAAASAGLPAGLRMLAVDGGRMRVMADLRDPQSAAVEPATIMARAPMSLEEVYLGLTGDAA